MEEECSIMIGQIPLIIITLQPITISDITCISIKKRRETKCHVINMSTQLQLMGIHYLIDVHISKPVVCLYLTEDNRNMRSPEMNHPNYRRRYKSLIGGSPEHSVRGYLQCMRLELCTGQTVDITKLSQLPVGIQIQSGSSRKEPVVFTIRHPGLTMLPYRHKSLEGRCIFINIKIKIR